MGIWGSIVCEPVGHNTAPSDREKPGLLEGHHQRLWWVIGDCPTVSQSNVFNQPVMSKRQRPHRLKYKSGLYREPYKYSLLSLPPTPFPFPLILILIAHFISLLYLLHNGHAYVLHFCALVPGFLSRRNVVDLKFDTQSAQYQREGHGFFVPLLIAGHILLPIMIVAAHLTKNRFSKSPILMNFCYANVGYCTSFLMSSVCVNHDGKRGSQRNLEVLCRRRCLGFTSSPPY